MCRLANTEEPEQQRKSSDTARASQPSDEVRSLWTVPQCCRLHLPPTALCGQPAIGENGQAHPLTRHNNK